MGSLNEILRLTIFDSAYEAKKFLSILKVFRFDLNVGVLYNPKINKFYLHQKKIRKEKKIVIII
jgi:hypothetical protein